MNRLFSDHAHVRNNRFERACVMCNYALACCNNNRFKLDGVAADAVVPGTSVNSCGIRQWNNSRELMRAVTSLRRAAHPRPGTGPAASENLNWSLFRVYERPPIRDPVPVHLILPTNNRANIPRSFDESVFFAGPQYNSGVPQRIRKNIPKSKDVGFRAL